MGILDKIIDRRIKRAFYDGQQSQFCVSYGSLSADYVVSALFCALFGVLSVASFCSFSRAGW